MLHRSPALAPVLALLFVACVSDEAVDRLGQEVGRQANRQFDRIVDEAVDEAIDGLIEDERMDQVTVSRQEDDQPSRSEEYADSSDRRNDRRKSERRARRAREKQRSGSGAGTDVVADRRAPSSNVGYGNPALTAPQGGASAPGAYFSGMAAAPDAVVAVPDGKLLVFRGSNWEFYSVPERVVVDGGTWPAPVDAAALWEPGVYALFTGTGFVFYDFQQSTLSEFFDLESLLPTDPSGGSLGWTRVEAAVRWSPEELVLFGQNPSTGEGEYVVYNVPAGAPGPVQPVAGWPGYPYGTSAPVSGFWGEDGQIYLFGFWYGQGLAQYHYAVWSPETGTFAGPVDLNEPAMFAATGAPMSNPPMSETPIYAPTDPQAEGVAGAAPPDGRPLGGDDVPIAQAGGESVDPAVFDAMFGPQAPGALAQFDGSGTDTIWSASDPRLTLSGSGAVSFWVRPGWDPAQPPGDPIPLVKHGSTSSVAWDVLMTGARNALLVADGWRAEEVRYRFDEDRPYHVLVVWNANRADIYIDGQPVRSGLPIGIAGPSGIDLPLTIGDFPFVGELGLVRVLAAKPDANTIFGLGVSGHGPLGAAQSEALVTAQLGEDRAVTIKEATLPTPVAGPFRLPEPSVRWVDVQAAPVPRKLTDAEARGRGVIPMPSGVLVHGLYAERTTPDAVYVFWRDYQDRELILGSDGSEFELTQTAPGEYDLRKTDGPGPGSGHIRFASGEGCSRSGALDQCWIWPGGPCGRPSCTYKVAKTSATLCSEADTIGTLVKREAVPNYRAYDPTRLSPKNYGSDQFTTYAKNTPPFLFDSVGWYHGHGKCNPVGFSAPDIDLGTGNRSSEMVTSEEQYYASHSFGAGFIMSYQEEGGGSSLRSHEQVAIVGAFVHQAFAVVLDESQVKLSDTFRDEILSIADLGPDQWKPQMDRLVRLWGTHFPAAVTYGTKWVYEQFIRIDRFVESEFSAESLRASASVTAMGGPAMVGTEIQGGGGSQEASSAARELGVDESHWKCIGGTCDSAGNAIPNDADAVPIFVDFRRLDELLAPPFFPEFVVRKNLRSVLSRSIDDYLNGRPRLDRAGLTLTRYVVELEHLMSNSGPFPMRLPTTGQIRINPAGTDTQKEAISGQPLVYNLPGTYIGKAEGRLLDLSNVKAARFGVTGAGLDGGLDVDLDLNFMGQFKCDPSRHHISFRDGLWSPRGGSKELRCSVPRGNTSIPYSLILKFKAEPIFW